MYEDPKVPASLQNRKRELHRRRASRKLGMYFVKCTKYIKTNKTKKIYEQSNFY